MYRLWDTFIRPLLEAVHAREVVEIGSESGLNTVNLAAFCKEQSGMLHTIDPHPIFNEEAFTREYEGYVRTYRMKSLEALPQLQAYDAVLIDGDHNWYTVTQELKRIDERSGDTFPLVLLHDVGWPYARRDLYYDPASIPDVYKHPHAACGIVPGQRELSVHGINENLHNALSEGGERNGVLTAVEFFLSSCRRSLDFIRIPGFHGLGIIADTKLLSLHPQLATILQSIHHAPWLTAHIETVENDRVRELTERINAQTFIETLSTQLRSAEKQREATSAEILSVRSEIDTLRSQQEQYQIEQEQRENSLMETIDRKERELQHAIKASEELTNRLDEKQRALEKMTQQEELLWVRIETLRKMNASSQEIIRKTTQDLDALKQENGQLEQTIGILQTDIQTATHEKETIEQKHRSLQAEHADMQTELTDAQFAHKKIYDAMQHLQKTRSWRWTAPLRRLDALIKNAARSALYTTFDLGKKWWRKTGRPMPPMFRSIRFGIFGRIAPVRRATETTAPASDVQPSLPSPKSTVTADVAVIIPCHNYGKYLANTIESVLWQTVKPSIILVVDDASTDDTADVAARYADAGVEYLRVDHHSLSDTRNTGAQKTRSEFLVFVDSDDALPANYIEACLAEMRDPSVAIAYGDMWDFEESDMHHIMPAFRRDHLLRSNYMSSHAMIRRQAYDMVGGYRNGLVEHLLEDWDLYRRILLYPSWSARKAHTHVHYRVHSDSMLQTYQKSDDHAYWRSAGLLQMPVTIFTPFAGRREVLPLFAEAIRQLDFDPSLIRLHWFDTSNDPIFSSQLKEELASMQVGRTTYTRAPLPDMWGHSPESLIKNRVSNGRNAQYYYELVLVYAYNTFLASCDTEYALVLEDDIIPSPAALRDLLQTFDSDVSAVVAHYPCILQDHSAVWSVGGGGYPVHFKNRGTGIQEVGGSGFGCSLFRMADLRRYPIYTRVFDTPPRWYDYNAYTHLSEHGKVLCNWDIDVTHMETERFRTTSNRESRDSVTL